MSFKLEEHYGCPYCKKAICLLIDVAEGIYQELKADCPHCHRPIGIEVELENEEVFDLYAYRLEEK